MKDVTVVTSVRVYHGYLVEDCDNVCIVALTNSYNKLSGAPKVYKRNTVHYFDKGIQSQTIFVDGKIATRRV